MQNSPEASTNPHTSGGNWGLQLPENPSNGAQTGFANKLPQHLLVTRDDLCPSYPLKTNSSLQLAPGEASCVMNLVKKRKIPLSDGAQWRPNIPTSFLWLQKGMGNTPRWGGWSVREQGQHWGWEQPCPHWDHRTGPRRVGLLKTDLAKKLNFV